MQKLASNYLTLQDYRDYLDTAMDEVSKLPRQSNDERAVTLCEVAIRTPLPHLLSPTHSSVVAGSAEVMKIGLTQHKYKALYPLLALVTAVAFHWASHRSQTAQNYVISFRGTPIFRYNHYWALSWLVYFIKAGNESLVKPKMLTEERFRETVPLVHYTEPSENDPYLIQLAGRISHEELIELEEIPEELFQDTFLQQLICPISRKPIRRPVTVEVRGQVYFCDRLHLLKYIPFMCNWMEKSSETIPGLNCQAKEVIVLARTNKVRQEYIDWRLHEISKVLAKIQGVPSKKTISETAQETIVNYIFQKFSWNKTIRRRVELYDRIDERFESNVNMVCDSSKSWSDRLIACVSSAFTLPPLFTSVIAINVEMKLLSIGQFIFGGHTKTGNLHNLYPDMFFTRKITHTPK